MIALGDFNDFEFSARSASLLGTLLTDMIDTLPADEQYTYVFDGNSQTLDHILASDAVLPAGRRVRRRARQLRSSPSRPRTMIRRCCGSGAGATRPSLRQPSGPDRVVLRRPDGHRRAQRHPDHRRDAGWQPDPTLRSAGRRHARPCTAFRRRPRGRAPGPPSRPLPPTEGATLPGAVPGSLPHDWSGPTGPRPSRSRPARGPNGRGRPPRRTPPAGADARMPPSSSVRSSTFIAGNMNARLLAIFSGGIEPDDRRGACRASPRSRCGSRASASRPAPRRAGGGGSRR